LLNVCGCSLEATGNALQVPDYLEARFVDRQRILRTVSSAVMLLFFTFYVSAGLVGTSAVFEGVFEVNYSMALWASATVIVTYIRFWGFLAALAGRILSGA